MKEFSRAEAIKDYKLMTFEQAFKYAKRGYFIARQSRGCNAIRYENGKFYTGLTIETSVIPQDKQSNDWTAWCPIKRRTVRKGDTE